jgi:hypothetical protein
MASFHPWPFLRRRSHPDRWHHRRRCCCGGRRRSGAGRPDSHRLRRFAGHWTIPPSSAATGCHRSLVAAGCHRSLVAAGRRPGSVAAGCHPSPVATGSRPNLAATGCHRSLVATGPAAKHHSGRSTRVWLRWRRIRIGRRSPGPDCPDPAALPAWRTAGPGWSCSTETGIEFGSATDSPAAGTAGRTETSARFPRRWRTPHGGRWFVRRRGARAVSGLEAVERVRASARGSRRGWASPDEGCYSGPEVDFAAGIETAAGWVPGEAGSDPSAGWD